MTIIYDYQAKVLFISTNEKTEEKISELIKLEYFK